MRSDKSGERSGFRCARCKWKVRAKSLKKNTLFYSLNSIIIKILFRTWQRIWLNCCFLAKINLKINMHSVNFYDSMILLSITELVLILIIIVSMISDLQCQFKKYIISLSFLSQFLLFISIAIALFGLWTNEISFSEYNPIYLQCWFLLDQLSDMKPKLFWPQYCK